MGAEHKTWQQTIHQLPMPQCAATGVQHFSGSRAHAGAGGRTRQSVVHVGVLPHLPRHQQRGQRLHRGGELPHITACINARIIAARLVEHQGIEDVLWADARVRQAESPVKLQGNPTHQWPQCLMPGIGEGGAPAGTRCNSLRTPLHPFVA